MWLLYYSISGERGWRKGQTKEQLEAWLSENYDINNLPCDADWDIVDLKRMDLVEELADAKQKLATIKSIIG